MLYAALENRARQPYRPRVDLQAESFRVASRGGPRSAILKAVGDERDLWTAVEWLGFGVVLRDAGATPRWWGQVTRVEVQVGPFTYGVALDSMANSIQVAYEEQVPGSSAAGERATTGWLQDPTSLAAYGRKDALLSMSAASAEAALSYQRAALQIGRLPVPIIGLSDGGSAGLTVECSGWYQTLSWRQASAAPFGSEIAEGGTATETVAAGLIAGQPTYGMAQRFIALGAIPFAAGEIAVRAKRVGNPPPLQIGLLQDAGGVLGAVLDVVNIPAASVGASLDWVAATVGSRILLTPGQPYWITVGTPSLSGFDANNYYTVEHAAEDLALSGSFARYLGGWQYSQPGELYYRVGGVAQTSDLLASLVGGYGQFLSGVRVAPTGVHSAGFEDGDRDALEAVEALLDMGSTRSVRLLSSVDVERQLTITDEPSSASPRYRIGRDGQLKTRMGLPIPPGESPVGQWAQLEDVLPAGVNFSLIQDPTLVFIEEAEYHVAKDRWTPTLRGQRTVWDLE